MKGRLGPSTGRMSAGKPTGDCLTINVLTDTTIMISRIQAYAVCLVR
jgi:hypothetical protein